MTEASESLVEMAQAVRDHLKEFLQDQVVDVAKATFDRMKEHMEKRLSNLEIKFGAQVSLLREEILRFTNDKLEELHGRHTNSISSVEKSIHSREDILSVLRSLPTPQVSITLPPEAIVVKQLPAQVTLPEGAIHVHVDQKPSQVSVSIPENAISVKVDQKPSKVIIPENAIQVHVENNTPHISLEVPENAIQLSLETKQKVTHRKVIYDPTTGRPDRLVEVEE